MPSPFPGMDPFIECQEWVDFHTTLITVLREALAPQLGDRYVARVERRIYVEHDPEERARQYGADVALVEMSGARPAVPAPAGATAIAPIECELPGPVERREAYLVIRDRWSHEVITVVEVLSPTNKAPGSDGRRLYLTQRDEILESRAHLVELDLLRGGGQLPLVGPVPHADYYAIVSREHCRPHVDVYAWSVRDVLPEIPVPLKREDGEARLDLQAAFDIVYDRARYDQSLDYTAPLSPPLSPEEARWANDLLRTRGDGG
ncbi:MAG: DUF4058 family protein [Planctomycetes bacterium]|nr:DUF4058 family protein [Planctomycetota bacterium]